MTLGDQWSENFDNFSVKLTNLRGRSFKAETLNWGFSDLFDTRVKKLSVRMPDVHDYWDSDWDKIEQHSKQYRIERFGDNPNQRISVEDWVEIYSKSTNEKIPINEFLGYHLDNQLVTHSKKGTRLHKDSDSEVKEFSHNMRTPDLISELFDYQKVTITPGIGHGANRTRNQYYVQLPRILNISTERKNDDDYFHEFSIFFNRIINSCKKLLIPMLLRMKNGSTLEPSFSEEIGPNWGNSDLIGFLSSYKKISLGDFVENILDEISGAQTNHDVPINELISHLDNDFMDYHTDNVSTGDMAEVIVSIVKFCEVIKLNRFLEESFEDITFDIENSKIFADKNRKYPIKFSDLSSGIRQKFRIFTSVAMQVISADNSLILIDEPEISLHLSWQRTFVDDLVEFLEDLTSKSRTRVDSEDPLENIISIIISTHSPAVLANHFHRGQKIGRVICLENSPRSRKELHDIFLQRTKAEIAMGQYSKSEPLVVVEGVLDTKLVDKLRNRNLAVIPIEKLIKATIQKNTERRRTKSARELVEIVCNLFIDSGFKFVFGIRDADTFALNEFVRNRKWNFKQKPSHIFDTRPCRDMETVLYSALHFGNKFVQNFPKEI